VPDGIALDVERIAITLVSTIDGFACGGLHAARCDHVPGNPEQPHAKRSSCPAVDGPRAFSTGEVRQRGQKGPLGGSSAA